MAIEATWVYKKHAELFDDEALDMVRTGEFARHARTIKLLAKAQQSGSWPPCEDLPGHGRRRECARAGAFCTTCSTT
jgi:hypothetical protein